MIDTKALRKKILELAFNGKLSSSNSTDNSSEELVKSIYQQKEILVREKKISKIKQMNAIKEDEMIFDIPSGWGYYKLGELCLPLSDGVHYAPEYQDNGYKCFSAKDIYNNRINDNDCTYITEEEYISMKNKINVQEGSILVTKSGSIGRSAVVDKYFEFGLVESIGVINPIFVDSEYIKYVLDYGFVYSSYYYEKYTRGVGLKHLTLTLLENIPIPLPPLTEQKNLVKTIKNAFELMDKIDTLQQQYEADLSVLKGKIIDAGIRGKLTKQLPEDGDAEIQYSQIQEEKAKLIKEGKIKKEKPLPAIGVDEIPFEIPKNWKWVMLSDVLDVRDGTHDSPQYHKEGIPLVTSKNLSTGIIDYENIKYISQKDADAINARSRVDDGDILFAMIGTIGNPVLVKKEKEFCIKNVALFKKIAEGRLSMEYVHTFLLAEQYEFRRIVSGGLQPFISLKQFRAHLMPLPPLAEQKRITEKIDEVLKYINN